MLAMLPISIVWLLQYGSHVQGVFPTQGQWGDFGKCEQGGGSGLAAELVDISWLGSYISTNLVLTQPGILPQKVINVLGLILLKCSLISKRAKIDWILGCLNMVHPQMNPDTLTWSNWVKLVAQDPTAVRFFLQALNHCPQVQQMWTLSLGSLLCTK